MVHRIIILLLFVLPYLGVKAQTMVKRVNGIDYVLVPVSLYRRTYGGNAMLEFCGKKSSRRKMQKALDRSAKDYQRRKRVDLFTRSKTRPKTVKR